MADEIIDEEEEIIGEGEQITREEDELGEDEEIIYPEEDGGIGEDRFWNIAGSSAVLGAGPRVEALAKYGPAAAFGLDKPEINQMYDEYRDKVFEANTAYRRRSPGTAVVADVLGAAPTALVPGLGAGRVARAALPGHTIARDLTAAERALRAVGHGKNVGGVGSESAALGTKYGVGQGFLSSRGEGVDAQRFGDAAIGGAVGLVTGAGAGKVAQIGGRVIREAGELAREAAEAGQNVGRTAAVRKMANELNSAGVTTDQLRSALPYQDSVAGSKLKGRMIREAMKSSADPVDEYVRLMKTQTESLRAAKQSEATLEQNARDAMARASDTTPLSIDELASTIPDAAGNTQRAKNLVDTRRAVAKMPGEHQEDMFNSVMNRQEELIERASNKLDHVAPAQYADLEGLMKVNRDNSRVFYKDAELDFTPFKLDKVFDEVHATQPFRGSKPRKALDDALNIMRGNKMADGTYEQQPLQTWIDNRSALNQLIEDSRTDLGKATASTVALQDFKKKMDKIVADSNPMWKVANDQHAAGRSVEGAHKLGRKMTIGRTSKANRDVISRLSTIESEISRHSKKIKALTDKLKAGKLSDEGKEELAKFQAFKEMLQNERTGYRMGFAEQLQDHFSNAGDLHDPAKAFMRGGSGSAVGLGGRSRLNPKETIRKVLGKEEGDEFLKEMERIHRASQTKNQYGGSQTAEMLQKIKDEGYDDQINAFNEFATINPIGLASAVARRTAAKFSRQRNKHLGPMFNVRTDDLQGFEKLLADIDAHNAPTRNLFANRYESPVDRALAAAAARSKRAVPALAGRATGSNTIENMLGAKDDTQDWEDEY